MKTFKLFAVIFAVFAGTLLWADDVMAGFWFNNPSKVKRSDVDVAIGLPVFDGRELDGAALALCGSKFKKADGFQGTLIGFNSADTLEGIQLSFVNFINRSVSDWAVQLGFFNHSAKNGVQIGFINNCQNNAPFQFGLVNINKKGLLPFMIFVNFGKDLFD